MSIIGTSMVNLLTSPVSSAAVQNSVFQVMSEGSLKAVGRPTITLCDKKTTPEARKYSATREFIYQTLCLAFYFAIVFPVFKQGAYKVLKKMKMFKTDPGFQFANFKQFKNALANNKEIDMTRSKGAMEAVSILGSAATLTLIAPQFVNKAIHPIMKQVQKLQDKNKAKTGLQVNG